jgi:hypothetical protein
MLALGFAMLSPPMSQAALAQEVPSGQTVTLQEFFLETQATGETWARGRYILPALSQGQGLTYQDVEADFVALCERDVLPQLKAASARVTQIIISIADRETEFGVADPDATQFFEAFRPDGSTCIWEGF